MKVRTKRKNFRALKKASRRISTKEIVENRIKHEKIKLANAHQSNQMRLMILLTLFLSLVAAMGVAYVLILQISKPTLETAWIQSESVASIRAIELRLEEISVALEKIQNTAVFEGAGHHMTELELTELVQDVSALLDRNNSSAPGSVFLNMIAGFAMWGFVFLFSAPFIAVGLSGAMWHHRSVRGFTYSIFLVGIVGSIYTIGVLYLELASELAQQFAWLAPPLLLGTAFATFVTTMRRVSGAVLGFVNNAATSVASLVAAVVLFLIVMPRSENCKNAFSLKCKFVDLTSGIEFSIYLLSFGALLFALFFYLISTIVVLRNALARG